MIVKPVDVKDVFATNAYFYIDEQTKHGFLIDPAAEPETLLNIIRDNNWVIEKMLITHGHFDHLGAVEKLHQTLGIDYFAHQNTKDYLQQGELNLSAFCNRNICLTEAKYFNDEDEIILNANRNVLLKVIHTPGHTPDSVVFYDKNNHIAFVGDTIFKGSIGATEYPGGNPKHLQQSILQKIFALPKETVLYSGHSEPTTVGAEKSRYNI